MNRLAACACSMALAASSTLLAKEHAATRAIYCWQGPKGDWTLQRFKPLIKVQGGTVFAELSFAGTYLGELKLRRFYDDSELAFDYTFDSNGRLTGLKGSVQVKTVVPEQKDADGQPMVFADWLGEADLMPGADGKIPPHHIVYSRENDRIDKPDVADKYVARFYEAPIYTTTQAVPCAAMLQEAEKMNATQE